MANQKTTFLIQDNFLARQCQRQILVSIYLLSGIRLRGKISGFDAISVRLDSDAQQLVYKKAIATIVPD